MSAAFEFDPVASETASPALQAEELKSAPGARTADPPLAVDMDHTLLRTDLLMEGIAACLFHRPVAFVAALPRLLAGAPAFKRAIAAAAPLDAGVLPLRDDLVSLLRDEKHKGRELHLVTAADEEAAKAVAARTGLFTSVIGSLGRRNLKGRVKRAALEKRFPDGFAYAGDSGVDLAVWKGARTAVLVGVSPATAAAVRRDGPPVETELPSARDGLAAWGRALRPHQWAKNLLIFAPLLLSQAATMPGAFVSVAAGFALLCLAASSSYVLNDLADLDSDRRHATKRTRPFASGDASVGKALIFAPLGLAAACGAAFALSNGFGLALLGYVATTTFYSMGLKRVIFLDAVILGLLYTLRLVMGAEAASIVASNVIHSQWLLTFAMFFFVSLTLAKRHVEVLRLAERDAQTAAGRGYRADDWPLTLAIGASAGAAAVLILVLYLMEDAFPAEIYPQPIFLWAAPFVGALVLGRIWLTAHRKELDDDPAAFAVRDPFIVALAVLLLGAFALASL